MLSYKQILSDYCITGNLAMLLAAGRGKRMMPLTAQQAKPLLILKNKPIMQWQLESLCHFGIDQVVINAAWCKENIYQYQQNNQHNNLLPKIEISDEISYPALETAGGVVKALPKLATAFWLSAGDIYIPEFNFSAQTYLNFLQSAYLAHLWLVPNPEHNPNGDFYLTEDHKISNIAQHSNDLSYTYSAIGLYRKELFMPPYCNIASGNPQSQRLALAPLIRQAANAGLVSGQIYQGLWSDVGTVSRLEQLNNDKP